MAATLPFFEFLEDPRVCSYLPEEVASLQYRGYESLSAAELEELVSRGWRRFASHVFRPACTACEKCLPIRIDVEKFRPTKSQRRAWSKNSQISVELATPILSQSHINLYNAWHVDMADRKDWPEQVADPQDYYRSFLAGDFESAHELRYFKDGELVGIGLIDLMPQSISSIYFYHAPSWRVLSPGTYSLLCEIELARQLGLKWVYLGYWIKNSTSMAYKNNFQPAEILRSRPDQNSESIWLKGGEEDRTLPSV